MKARVADRGQVTIPKRLREKLGVHPGTVLEFEEQDGRLVATKVETSDPISAVFGCLKRKINTDTVMTELRGRS